MRARPPKSRCRAKGKKIFAAMKKTYGVRKRRDVFYASQNKKTITGTHKPRRKAKQRKGR